MRGISKSVLRSFRRREKPSVLRTKGWKSYRMRCLSREKGSKRALKESRKHQLNQPSLIRNQANGKPPA
jgi:hypothetical protein